MDIVTGLLLTFAPCSSYSLCTHTTLPYLYVCASIYLIHYVEQGSAKSGPRAKSSPQDLSIQPAAACQLLHYDRTKLSPVEWIMAWHFTHTQSVTVTQWARHYNLIRYGGYAYKQPAAAAPTAAWLMRQHLVASGSPQRPASRPARGKLVGGPHGP